VLAPAELSAGNVYAVALGLPLFAGALLRAFGPDVALALLVSLPFGVAFQRFLVGRLPGKRGEELPLLVVADVLLFVAGISLGHMAVVVSWFLGPLLALGLIGLALQARRAGRPPPREHPPPAPPGEGVTHLPSRGKVEEDLDDSGLDAGALEILEVERSNPAMGALCPYCGEGIEPDEPRVRCERCRTLHHDDCWRDARGCTTYGCAGASSAG
jgi:hypothetical protein